MQLDSFQELLIENQFKPIEGAGPASNPLINFKTDPPIPGSKYIY